LVLEKNANFLRRKLSKIAENRDHNIDPETHVVKKFGRLGVLAEDEPDGLGVASVSGEVERTPAGRVAAVDQLRVPGADFMNQFRPLI
jgi:hypothetical protein